MRQNTDTQTTTINLLPGPSVTLTFVAQLGTKSGLLPSSLAPLLDDVGVLDQTCTFKCSSGRN